MENKPKNYVNNAEFTEMIRKHRANVQMALETGSPKPRIPEEAGRIIMEIAERYSRRHNFRNYQFRDEMIANGIEAAIKGFNNFDPDKFSNPLSYFTQCIHYAFIGIIKKEKTLLYTKINMIRDVYQEFMDILEHDDSIDSKQKNYLLEFLDRNEQDIEFGFLNKKPTKKKEKVKKVYESPIDEFFSEDVDANEP